jgi:hypothetical protein
MPDRPQFAPAPPDFSSAQDAFPCPACGQMLGPRSRVCAVCKTPVDPQEIARPAPVVERETIATPPIPPERVRFPWGLFGILLVARLTVAAYLNQHQGLNKTFLILGGIEVICGAWVAFDALQRGIPKAFRWGLGSALLWPLIFPWYLTRRGKPQAVCPFVEAEVGPVTRVVFFALVVFFLISFLAVIFKGPPPG